MRTAWGTSRPMKPIAPTAETVAAVMRATRISTAARTPTTGTPIDFAVSSPKLMASK